MGSVPMLGTADGLTGSSTEMDGECQDETRRLEELEAGWSSGSGKEEGNALEKGNPWCYPTNQTGQWPRHISLLQCKREGL